MNKRQRKKMRMTGVITRFACPVCSYPKLMTYKALSDISPAQHCQRCVWKGPMLRHDLQRWEATYGSFDSQDGPENYVSAPTGEATCSPS